MWHVALSLCKNYVGMGLQACALRKLLENERFPRRSNRQAWRPTATSRDGPGSEAACYPLEPVPDNLPILRYRPPTINNVKPHETPKTAGAHGEPSRWVMNGAAMQ